MTKKRIKSRHGLFGMVYHYDENGKYVGKSRPGLWGDRTIHYDDEGKHTATSRPGVLAEEVHYDKKNKRYISSYPDLVGSFHRSNGRTIGKTRPGFFDSSYTTLESDDDECAVDLEYEAFSECDEKENDVENNAVTADEKTTSSDVQQKQNKGKSIIGRIIKKVIKLLIGVPCLLWAVICAISILAMIVSGDCKFSTLLARLLCTLFFGLIARWGLRSNKT